METTRRLDRLLNPLGFVSRYHRQGDQKRRYYLLDPEMLADLREHYKLADQSSEET